MPIPSTGFEPVPLGCAPIVLAITPREQAHLASFETNTSDTHPPAASETQTCITKHSNCCACTRACVCVRVSARVCVCVIMRRRLLMLSWLFHQDCCVVATHPDHGVGKGSFVVISECFTEFSPHVTFFCCFFVEKWVAAGRRLQRCLASACMSKLEQHFAQSSGVRMAG